MTGLFAQFQPLYAEHGITTIPCSTVSETKVKKPLVSHWQQMGLSASHQLARKFSEANAIGFVAGKRNRVTNLDVDSRDQRVLEDAIARHGESRFIVRTASRKFQAYYRYNGELRKIRPWPDLPIDVLGGGLVMAPPSLYGRGQYEIIHGTLDDLDRLTTMQGVDDLKLQARQALQVERATIGKGRRNSSLFNYLLRYAASIRPNCTLAALKAEARDFNAKHCIPQLEEMEIMTVASNVWAYEASGNNRCGQHGAWLSMDEIAAILVHQDAFMLLAFLRANNGPDSLFMCANGLSEKFGWDRRKLAAARHRLIEMRYIKPIRQAGRGHPALFQWAY
jgi:hypothetical protein